MTALHPTVCRNPSVPFTQRHDTSQPSHSRNGPPHPNKNPHRHPTTQRIHDRAPYHHTNVSKHRRLTSHRVHAVQPSSRDISPRQHVCIRRMHCIAPTRTHPVFGILPRQRRTTVVMRHITAPGRGSLPSLCYAAPNGAIKPAGRCD